jgi:Contractile injection system tube protein
MAIPAAPPPPAPHLASANEGKLVRLSLIKVDSNGDVLPGSPFNASLNPQKFKHSQSITYNSKESLGSRGSTNKFAAQPPGTATCELLLDGTGAVPPASKGRRLDVSTQIERLRFIVYAFDGDKHEPGHVKLIWGTLLLYVRLKSMDIDYTLFKPDGSPLRASVSLQFTEFFNFKQAQAKARLSSPDMTHAVTVREGDTLPLLCQRIYGDQSYYTAVARENGLTDLRRLVPGSLLRFPRLA